MSNIETWTTELKGRDISVEEYTDDGYDGCGGASVRRYRDASGEELTLVEITHDRDEIVDDDYESEYPDADPDTCSICDEAWGDRYCEADEDFVWSDFNEEDGDWDDAAEKWAARLNGAEAIKLMEKMSGTIDGEGCDAAVLRDIKAILDEHFSEL